MRPAVKLSAFGFALAVVFGAAWTVGAAVGPLNPTPAPMTGDPAHGHPTDDPAPTTPWRTTPVPAPGAPR